MTSPDTPNSCMLFSLLLLSVLMGLGLSIRESIRIEFTTSNRYVRITFPHDQPPGETTISFPSHLLPEFISGFRALAGHIGLPTKASWDGDYLLAVYDHTGEGRPVTPQRTQRPPL